MDEVPSEPPLTSVDVFTIWYFPPQTSVAFE